MDNTVSTRNDKSVSIWGGANSNDCTLVTLDGMKMSNPSK